MYCSLLACLCVCTLINRSMYVPTFDSSVPHSVSKIICPEKPLHACQEISVVFSVFFLSTVKD